MRVLVTGGAGFIGSHVADRLAAEGHEPVVLDALIPQAHGGEKPPWVGELLHADVRDAGRAAGGAARGRRRVPPGRDGGPRRGRERRPAYAAHNDLGTAVLLAAMYEAGVPGSCWPGSMVVYGEGRYTCGEHGVVRPGPRAPDDIAAGRFEPPCPVCGRDLEPGLVPEDAPLDPRSTYAATKLAQEHLAGAWARQTGGAVWALRYHNVYGSRMPRDTPYSGVASVFRSALERGEAPRVMEDGRAAPRLRARQRRRRGQRPRPRTPPPTGFTAVNVCSGEPHTVGDLATELAGRCAARNRSSSAAPGRATCGTWWPTRPGRRALLGFTAGVRFAEGVRAFATDPLRAPAATEP